jgi:hypothetical protein
LIEGSHVRDGDYVEAKAQKSWDKSKNHWSWKIVEIRGCGRNPGLNEEYQKWADEIEQQNKIQEDLRDADYLKWVEDSLAISQEKVQDDIV